MLRKINVLCCVAVMLLLGSCSSINTNADKPVKSKDGIDISSIQSQFANRFDSIIEFYELTPDDMLVIGNNGRDYYAGKYDFKSNTFTETKTPLKYDGVHGFIGFLNDGFYTSTTDDISIYDDDLNLKQTIDAPNSADQRQSYYNNPMALSKDGKKLYYSINNNMTQNLMEMDVQTNDKKVITEYEKPDELTMISAMAVTDDNTIAFVGQTLIPNKQERSVGSYGTINISSGKIDNHILNYIQFKYGNDIALVTDRKDTRDTDKPKNYVLELNGTTFEKHEVKSASYDVKPCSKHIFIAHDIYLTEDNKYKTYISSIYKDGKDIKDFDDSGKYKYLDYLTDFYSDKYGLYFQAVYDRSDQKNILNIKSV